MGNETEFDRTVTLTNRIIATSQKELDKAILSGDWSRASELLSFISGMGQTLIVFQQAKTRILCDGQ